MSETIGTLNLKIARLKMRLSLLEQQQALSGPYPYHQSQLIQEGAQVRFQLHQLRQYREELLRQVTNYMTGRLVDGSGQREQSFYPTC
jgi:hypothetical protein